MYKTTSTLLLLAFVFSLLLVSGTATAQGSNAQEDIPSKHYDMETVVLDGEIKRPLLEYYRNHGTPKFKRLLRLQRSFLPHIEAEAKNQTMR